MSDSTPDLLEALGAVRDALDETRVPHVFIGAIPVLAWGRPRATTDVDVAIFCEADAFATLVTALGQRGIQPGSHVGPSDPADELPDIAVFWTASHPSVRIDVFVAKMEFERAVLATARHASVLGSRLTVASREASIIYKLLASRSKDLADVDSMFEAARAAGIPIDWAFLDRWANEWELTALLAPYRTR